MRKNVMTCPKCEKTTVPVTQHGATRQVCAACDTPDRTCTWCKVAMSKRLIGNGTYLHYLCPKCRFQHTAKLA